MAKLSDIFAFVKRRPAAGTGHEVFSPATRNVRPVEKFSRHRAPDQIYYGDTPARASRQQIYTALAIAPYKAVMRDDFWISTLNTPNYATTLWGRSGYDKQRFNIKKPQADAWGSLVPLLAPPDPYAEQNPFLK